MLPLILAASIAHPLHETPDAALQRVYAEYRKPDFNPLAHPERYFAPRLLRAVLKDERLAGPGSVGYLDGDPLCQCQDSAGFHGRVMKVTATSHSAAIARVRLEFSQSPEQSKSSIRISMVATPAGWRIADVSSSGEPSLLRALENSNRRQSSKRR